MARARDVAHVADWRGEAFRVLAPDSPLPSVAATLLQAGGAAEPVPGSWACVATAVHFSAGMSTVTLPGDGILRLSPDEAQALAADFGRVFDGAEVRLSVRLAPSLAASEPASPAPNRPASLPASRSASHSTSHSTSRSPKLLCVFEQPLEVVTHDPEDMVGHDVFAFQPSGPAAPRLRRLMSEMEMWLFDHEVNRARAAIARPSITGLWLWGGGPKGEAVPAVHGWTAGDDPFFAAFGGEPEMPRATDAGVIVCAEQPGSSDWLAVEQRWLAPAAAALRAGRIERLALSAGERCFNVGRHAHLRFWRRPKPWWESYGIQ